MGRRRGTTLFLSSTVESAEDLHNLPTTIEEEPDNVVRLVSGNPMQRFFSDLRSRDLKELINTAALVAVAGLVLWQLTTIDSGLSRGWTAEEVWASYSDVLDRRPIVTKAATSGTVYAVGDIIAQRTEGTSIGNLDRMRIVRSLLAGLIGHGPLSHIWYGLCDSLFDDVLGWTQWWSFFPKVLVDQATWGPFWNNTYILLLGLMKLASWETMWGDMKRTTIPLIVSGLKVWPLAHCVTYGLVPVENRLLWVDMVEIVWVTILATTATSAAAENAEIEPEKAARSMSILPPLAASLNDGPMQQLGSNPSALSPRRQSSPISPFRQTRRAHRSPAAFSSPMAPPPPLTPTSSEGSSTLRQLLNPMFWAAPAMQDEEHDRSALLPASVLSEL